VAGIGASTLSTLPPVHLYGPVIVIVLVATMLGGLLFLPALIAMLERRRPILKSYFALVFLLSVRRGMISTNEQGRCRLSNCSLRIPSHASLQAPGEPGRQKM
jgi:hypothetical protein